MLPCFGFRPPATQSIQERQRSKKSRNTVLFPMFSGSGVSKSKLFDITTEVRKNQCACIPPELFSWRCPFCVRVCCLPSDSLKGDPEGLQFLCFGFRPPPTPSTRGKRVWRPKFGQMQQQLCEEPARENSETMCCFQCFFQSGRSTKWASKSARGCGTKRMSKSKF